MVDYCSRRHAVDVIPLGECREADRRSQPLKRVVLQAPQAKENTQIVEIAAVSRRHRLEHSAHSVALRRLDRTVLALDERQHWHHERTGYLATPGQFFPGDGTPVNGDIAQLWSLLSIQPDVVLIAGDLTEVQVEHLAELPNVIIPMAATRTRRASVLAEIGWRRFVNRSIDDPISLAPVYVHSLGAPVKR